MPIGIAAGGGPEEAPAGAPAATAGDQEQPPAGAPPKAAVVPPRPAASPEGLTMKQHRSK